MSPLERKQIWQTMLIGLTNRFHKVRCLFQVIKSPINEESRPHYHSTHKFVAFIEIGMRLFQFFE